MPIIYSMFYMRRRSVDDLDLYTGLLSERPLDGSILGPTITCLLADQFLRTKLGDRYWYETGEKPQAFDEGKDTRFCTQSVRINHTSFPSLPVSNLLPQTLLRSAVLTTSPSHLIPPSASILPIIPQRKLNDALPFHCIIVYLFSTPPIHIICSSSVCACERVCCSCVNRSTVRDPKNHVCGDNLRQF
jgi:hypothetical protein